MTMTKTGCQLLAAATLIVSLGTHNAAAGGLCANLPVAARGELASFEWLAKTKARANWRSRVRATKALGESYSSWNRAKERQEVCDNWGRGIVCTFSGIPCQR